MITFFIGFIFGVLCGAMAMGSYADKEAKRDKDTQELMEMEDELSLREIDM